MSERKYTDEEIIKAFELCLTPQGTTYTCKKCPLHELGNLCKVERNRGLLALVKTQKADLEIAARQFDDLAKVSNKLHSENMSQRAELERLREYYKLYFDREREIKEFQENIEHLQGKISLYEAEVERLRGERDMWRNTAYHEASITEEQEVKAIKEFAERLKANMCHGYIYLEIEEDLFRRDIDNLVAEMTEGK